MNKPTHPDPRVKPIDEVVIKVASLCNLNCSYCYMYNLTPGSLEFWRKQPRFVSSEIVSKLAVSAREYFERREVTNPRLVFHGGEPLLAGTARFEEWFRILGEVFKGSKIELRIGVQTNGILFDYEWGELFRRWGIHVGISVDGAPGVHDDKRVDHKQRPAGIAIERGIKLLSEEYRDVFSGLLAVVDLAHDPVAVIDYLLRWEPPSIDLLLPLDTHDRLPDVKKLDIEDLSYGKWLAAVGNRLIELKSKVPVRCLNNLFERLAAKDNTGLLFGDSWDVVSIRPDGGIEILDTFLSSDPSLRSLNLNISERSFFDIEAALNGFAGKASQLLAVPKECEGCQYLSVCGGCVLSSRYSVDKQYQNRSFYCSDMKHLIDWGRNLCAAE